jgi:outer membrane protein assembly factor BamB
MKHAAFALLAVFVLIVEGPPARADSAVLTYHGDSERSGRFTVPSLTWDRAQSLHLDPAFHAELSGHIYAQPLYWQPPGSSSGLLIAVTEENVVYALDVQTGHIVWKRELGTPVARSLLSCGNIDPVGITGTPVIDPTSETLFLDADVAQSSEPHHLVFALALKDGAILPGWPVDIAEALAGKEPPFVARVQNQRGALLIARGTLYVPFGGNWGDCGTYHGTVVGISLSDPRRVMNWSTRAVGGGIWAPGGIASDGTSLFVATGNTFNAKRWADGEAIIRLPLNLQDPNDERDFFAPDDWRSLDARDADLGGTSPLLFDVPAGNGRQSLILALGKDGKAYLLDAANLGGISGALAVAKASTRGIFAAAAAYPVGNSVYVAFPGTGVDCPKGREGNGLVVLSVRGAKPPALSTAWCAPIAGVAAPIVTTTDGRSDPIVWDLGAEGDNRLHAFKGTTGEELFSGPDQGLTGLRHFQTLIATANHLYIVADETIYAFAF